jgi:hypothetical protein
VQVRAAVVCRLRSSATPSRTPEAATSRCTASVMSTNWGAFVVGTETWRSVTMVASFAAMMYRGARANAPRVVA